MLALFVLIGFLLGLPLLYRLWVPDAVPDTSLADKRQLDSLVALLEESKTAGIDERQKTPGNVEPAGESKKIERFAFNPNTLNAESWQRLGTPRWLAERIVRYRSKGGQFRKKEDLLKIYDFSPELYAELEPYIQLNAQTFAEKPTSKPERFSSGEFPRKPAPESRDFASAGGRFTKPVLSPFDINTADTTELKQLRGIGSRLASRIVKFRDALGGFVSTDQYTEIFGLDSLVVSELNKYGQVMTAARKLPINTATAEELDRHVYLSRRQAEIIINYRNQHGPFASAESLRNIRVLDAKTIEKLTPYLAF